MSDMQIPGPSRELHTTGKDPATLRAEEKLKKYLASIPPDVQAKMKALTEEIKEKVPQIQAEIRQEGDQGATPTKKVQDLGAELIKADQTPAVQKVDRESSRIQGKLPTGTPLPGRVTPPAA